MVALLLPARTTPLSVCRDGKKRTRWGRSQGARERLSAANVRLSKTPSSMGFKSNVISRETCRLSVCQRQVIANADRQDIFPPSPTIMIALIAVTAPQPDFACKVGCNHHQPCLYKQTCRHVSTTFPTGVKVADDYVQVN